MKQTTMITFGALLQIMYLARDLTRARQHLDEDEFLDVVTMPFDTLVEQVMSGEITDAKTVATVLKVKTLLGR